MLKQINKPDYIGFDVPINGKIFPLYKGQGFVVPFSNQTFTVITINNKEETIQLGPIKFPKDSFDFSHAVTPFDTTYSLLKQKEALADVMQFKCDFSARQKQVEVIVSATMDESFYCNTLIKKWKTNEDCSAINLEKTDEHKNQDGSSYFINSYVVTFLTYSGLITHGFKLTPDQKSIEVTYFNSKSAASTKKSISFFGSISIIPCEFTDNIMVLSSDRNEKRRSLIYFDLKSYLKQLNNEIICSLSFSLHSIHALISLISSYYIDIIDIFDDTLFPQVHNLTLLKEEKLLDEDRRCYEYRPKKSSKCCVLM